MLEKISQNNGYPKKERHYKKAEENKKPETTIKPKKRIKTIFNQFSNILARVAVFRALYPAAVPRPERRAEIFGSFASMYF